MTTTKIPTKPKMTLEEKVNRLREIQELLESGKINLSQSVEYLKEALELKKQIEKELQAIENELINIDPQDFADKEKDEDF